MSFQNPTFEPICNELNILGDASQVPTTGLSLGSTPGLLGTIPFPVFGFGSGSVILTGLASSIIGAIAGACSITASSSTNGCTASSITGSSTTCSSSTICSSPTSCSTSSCGMISSVSSTGINWGSEESS